MKNHSAKPWVLKVLKRKTLIIIGESVLVLVHMLVFRLTGVSIAYVPILFGIVATALSNNVNMLVPVDFMHLSERAMLYVVFTFGEMIISITAYFDGKISISSLYFSAMAFLIVAGLFLSYEVLYNKIIERERTTNGTVYMLIHVFLILALDNISVALEFMREEEVALLPKIMFITGSFLLYFVCIFFVGTFANEKIALNAKSYPVLGVLAISFFALMLIFRTNMYLNIAISVLYVMGIFFILHRRAKLMDSEEIKSVHQSRQS